MIYLNPSDRCVKYFPIFSQFQALQIPERPTLKTPRGEFRLMANGDVDFNGMNISRYGLAPLKKWSIEDKKFHDMPVKSAA